MSVLIKGLKMPKEGLSVVVEIWNNGKAYVYGTGNSEMYDAVELPDHGDLIDRDAIRKDWKFSDSCNRCERVPYQCHYHEEMSIMDVCGMLDGAPVVIPAERSEDGET